MPQAHDAALQAGCASLHPSCFVQDVLQGIKEQDHLENGDSVLAQAKSKLSRG